MLILKDNEKDLADVPENVKKELEIIPITLIDEALNAALVADLTPMIEGAKPANDQFPEKLKRQRILQPIKGAYF